MAPVSLIITRASFSTPHMPAYNVIFSLYGTLNVLYVFDADPDPDATFLLHDDPDPDPNP
jgi:hypothetical protein